MLRYSNRAQNITILERHESGENVTAMAREFGVNITRMKSIMHHARDIRGRMRTRELFRIAGISPYPLPRHIERHYVTADEPDNIKTEMVLYHA